VVTADPWRDFTAFEQAKKTSGDHRSVHLLANEFCRGARKNVTAGTDSQYKGPWFDFRRWCKEVSLQACPAEPDTVALFLTLVRVRCQFEGHGYGPVKSASSAIHNHHKREGAPSPTKHPLCTTARDTAKRQLKSTKKRPRRGFLPKEIRKLVDHHLQGGKSRPSRLQDHIGVVGAALAFAGLFRGDDVQTINTDPDFMIFRDTHMEIFLCSSKTDQVADGCWVFISRVFNDDGTPSLSCPVALTEDLLKVGDYASSGYGPLVRGCKPDGSGLRDSLKPICSTTLRETLKRLCVEAGVCTDGLGYHSLRIGGTSAMANEGVPDRLICEHGRWRSVKVFRCYVRPDLEALLAPSRACSL
jgi:hypothetical protein